MRTGAANADSFRANARASEAAAVRPRCIPHRFRDTRFNRKQGRTAAASDARALARNESALAAPVRIICHSRYVIDRAIPFGWKPGARYTNLRDVKHLSHVYFVDIDWKNYDFQRHLDAVVRLKPTMTVARDVIEGKHLDDVLHEASVLAAHTQTVIVVPKDPNLRRKRRLGVPDMFRLGYSVPTRYGGTTISPDYYTGDVHLLGGRPDVQRQLAQVMRVKSLDGNRFTYDARFGDYFDGETFRPHPSGGYEECLKASLSNIRELWGGQPNG